MEEIDTNNSDKRISNQLHPVLDYFKYDADKNESSCLQPRCTYTVIGRHSNNLTKHIVRRHSELSEEINAELKEYRGNKNKKKRFSATKDDIITVKMSVNAFKNGMLELVNVNSRPFSLLKDTGMNAIIAPIIAACKDFGYEVSTDRESLQRESSSKRLFIKNRIKEEMKNKVFSICIDLGTATDGRSILGINTQFYHGQNMVYRCLAMKVNRKPATALRIALMIWMVLNEYGLDIDKLIAICSDNGANVLKCIKILRILQTHILDEYLNKDIEKIDFEMLQRLVDVEIENISEKSFLKGVKCCAHTLNLCLDDGMKGEAIEQNKI